MGIVLILSDCPEAAGYLQFHLIEKTFFADFQMTGDTGKDRCQCSHFDRAMQGNRNSMFAILFRLHVHVVVALLNPIISDSSQTMHQIVAGNVPWQLYRAAITSSCTK